MHQLRIFVYLLKLSISYDIQKEKGIKLSAVIKAAHSVSTVSSIQNTGSTETLLIKLELHFEGFSLYPLRAFLNVVTNLSPSQSFHHTSYHPMYGNPDISIVEMFTFGIRNSGLWNPEYISRNPESH